MADNTQATPGGGENKDEGAAAAGAAGESGAVSDGAAGGGGNSDGDTAMNADGAPGDIKVKDDKSAEHLNIKVKSQDGNEIYFKVKKTTQFRKVIQAYCKKVGSEPDSVRFLFDGQRIRPDQTPAELNMEDEDEIDAMVSQTGGHC